MYIYNIIFSPYSKLTCDITINVILMCPCSKIYIIIVLVERSYWLIIVLFDYMPPGGGFIVEFLISRCCEGKGELGYVITSFQLSSPPLGITKFTPVVALLFNLCLNRQLASYGDVMMTRQPINKWNALKDLQ